MLCHIYLIFSFIAFLGATPIDLDLSKQYIVEDLPGLDDIPIDKIPIMHAGHIELYHQNDTNYFFWKFQKRETVQNKTIFWLNGGPGCSSMDGALMESGPLRINKHGNVIVNEGSWSDLADMVFIDQPGGTGFSYTNRYDRELDEIAFDFLKFLSEYFKVFPQDLSNEIYLAGESYAGQYIPYIAKHMVDFGKYNLKGLLIGNGWISPNEQSLSYLPFALEAGLVSKTESYMPKLLKQQEKCQNLNNQTPEDSLSEISTDECEAILNIILDVTRDLQATDDQQCLNMYDYRLRDSFPSCGMNWPPDLKTVTPFLRNPDVLKTLNLKKKVEWSECDSTVSRFLKGKHSKPAVHLLPFLLQHLPIILFNGDKDIICNYIGTESFISKLKWNGYTGFSDDMIANDWIYDDNEVGIIKSERNLTFINIFESSHMVPFDLPDISRSLIDIIIGNFENKFDQATNKSLIITKNYFNQSMVDDSNSHEFTSLSLTNLLQFSIIFILIWGVYMIYKSDRFQSKPLSILSKNNNTTTTTKSHKKKKSVQWADQLTSSDFSIGNVSHNNQSQREFNQNSNSNHDSPLNNVLNKVFSRLGYNQHGYELTKNYEDIELGNTNELSNEFIIDSDDENSNKDENEV